MADESEALCDWHRLFGLLLTDFFSGSRFQVEVEPGRKRSTARLRSPPFWERDAALMRPRRETSRGQPAHPAAPADTEEGLAVRLAWR